MLRLLGSTWTGWPAASSCKSLQSILQRSLRSQAGASGDGLCLHVQVLAVFTVFVAAGDPAGQMEAGWETEADLLFLRQYDVFRADKGAVKLPTSFRNRLSAQINDTLP